MILPPVLLLSLRVVLAILHLLCFHVKCKPGVPFLKLWRKRHSILRNEVWSGSSSGISIWKRNPSFFLFIFLSSFFLYFVILWMFCLYVCLYTTFVSGTLRGQKRAPVLLGLELQLVVRHHGGTGDWVDSSTRAADTIYCWGNSQAPYFCFYFIFLLFHFGNFSLIYPCTTKL